MISILGWYDQRNVGDEAFKDAFRLAFELAGAKETLQFCTERAPPEKKIILGGGDVIRPYYLDKLESGQLVFPIGVGLGYESEAQLLKSKKVPIVVARNRADVEALQQAGVAAEYCPDLTFVLPDPKPAPPTSSPRKKLGLLLSDEVNPTFENRQSSDYMYYEYYKWELARILDELEEYYSIHFLPFSTLKSIDDRKMHLDVYRRMSKRAHAVFEEEQLSVPKARDLIAGYDLVVTMKYHGMLFAVQSGVPFINIAQTRKTALFCQENEFDFLSIPRFSLEKDRFLATVKKAEDGNTRSIVARKGSQLKQAARERLPIVIRRFLEAKT